MLELCVGDLVKVTDGFVGRIDLQSGSCSRVVEEVPRTVEDEVTQEVRLLPRARVWVLTAQCEKVEGDSADNQQAVRGRSRRDDR